MNQGENQFKFDLQLFAEDTTPEAAPAPETAEPTPEPTPAQDRPQEKHISEMTDDEQTDYIKRHFLDEEPDKEPPPPEQEQEEPKPENVQAPEPTQQAEATFEIVVNGQKKQVTQSELIKLAQMGEDYTKKTQALADQRRQFEAEVQQFRQGLQQRQQPQVKPSERLSADYKAATAIACQQLGIAPEEFNQFDPVHAFALQNVIVQANMQAGRQMSERQAVERAVQGFAAEISQDPMAKDINDNFVEQLLRRGLVDKENGIKAQRAIMAYDRFIKNQATLEDCNVLKEHWGYVKKELEKAKKPPAPPVPPATPPRTEAPGIGRSASGGGVMDIGKLRALSSNPDKQMAYMKSLGIFND